MGWSGQVCEMAREGSCAGRGSKRVGCYGSETPTALIPLWVSAVTGRVSGIGGGLLFSPEMRVAHRRRMSMGLRGAGKW